MKIKKLDIMDVQGLGRSFGFVTALDFNTFKRHFLLLPELRAFAPLAITQAHNRDLIPSSGMQGNSPTGTPDKISGVCADDKKFFTHTFSPFDRKVSIVCLIQV